MGFLTRAAPRQRVEPVLTRATQTYAPGWGALATMTGMSRGGPYLAENLSAVVGAVELISNAIASLPASIVVDSPEGRIPAPDSATAWTLLERPNARQSWPAMMVMTVSQFLLQGNALAALQMDGRGAVTSLTPVPWGWLNPKVISGRSGPRIVYDVAQATVETQLLGLPPRLLDTEIMHVRGRSDIGIVGRSVLSRAADVVREGIDLATAATGVWRNGLSPSGFIETGGPVLTDDQRSGFKARLDEYRGAQNAGKVMLLEGSFKFNQLALSPGDAQLLASRQFTVAEIARLFSIPEPMLQIGDRVPPSLDPFMAAFAQLALSPIVGLIESEFDQAVLPAGYHLQMDMSGLMRGNYSAVMAANCAAVQSRIMTPNDARRAVGLPAHDDGDDLGGGPAPNYPADAKGMPHLGPSPGKTGAGLPAPGTHQNDGAA